LSRRVSDLSGDSGGDGAERNRRRSMVPRLTSTWGFRDWRRRRMAAVPGTT